MPVKWFSFPCPSLKVIASLISGSMCRETRKGIGCPPAKECPWRWTLSAFKQALAQLEEALIQQGLLDPEDLEPSD